CHDRSVSISSPSSTVSPSRSARTVSTCAGVAAAEANAPLPPRYFTLFDRWFWFGIPGFGAVMAIVYLMIAKPF
ncbi:DUF2269 family protein, partial [Streptomyces scabiei]